MEMRALAALAACVFVLETDAAESIELNRARREAENVRSLVEAGALPRASLEEANRKLLDAEDDAVLHRTLYGSLSLEDLTEEQIGEMTGAARRRVERQEAVFEHAKKLVEEGVMPRMSLTPVLEELDARRKTFHLAESRGRLFRELAEMAQAEEVLETALERAPESAPQIAERFDGGGVFRMAQLRAIELDFEREFGRPLPVSARGETRLHRALGFDHRGRVDVALDPDHKEGVWLRRYLEKARIPFFAFRAFIPGKSTAPHIHIGPPSNRLRSSD